MSHVKRHRNVLHKAGTALFFCTTGVWGHGNNCVWMFCPKHHPGFPSAPTGLMILSVFSNLDNSKTV